MTAMINGYFAKTKKRKPNAGSIGRSSGPTSDVSIKNMQTRLATPDAIAKTSKIIIFL